MISAYAQLNRDSSKKLQCNGGYTTRQQLFYLFYSAIPAHGLCALELDAWLQLATVEKSRSELVQDVAAVSEVAPPMNPSIAATSLSTSHATNEMVHGGGGLSWGGVLFPGELEDNGPIND
ncbi:hypothetical protein EMCRGX_G008674 [Ephydatia muelleri]